MNVPAALVIESIPFAWMVLVTRRGSDDLFAILYLVGVGLLMSLIVWAGGDAGVDRVISAVGDLD